MPRDIRVVGVSCITVTDGDRARRSGLRQSIREALDRGHSAVREPLRMTTQCRPRSGSRERQYIPNPLLYPDLVSSQARNAIIIIEYGRRDPAAMLNAPVDLSDLLDRVALQERTAEIAKQADRAGQLKSADVMWATARHSDPM